MQNVIGNVVDYIIELNDMAGYDENEAIEFIEHCINFFGYNEQTPTTVRSIFEQVKHLITQ
jgi:hypothetical protein